MGYHRIDGIRPKRHQYVPDDVLDGDFKAVPLFHKNAVLGAYEFFQGDSGFYQRHQILHIPAGDGFLYFKPQESNLFTDAFHTSREVKVEAVSGTECPGIIAVLDGVLITLRGTPLAFYFM